MSTPPMPISVICESCASKLRAPEKMAGRRTRCPKCGSSVVVPAADGKRERDTSNDTWLHATEPNVPQSNSQPAVEQKAEQQSHRRVPSPKRRVSESPTGAAVLGEDKPSDKTLSVVFATWVAGAGLVLLSASPLFYWINFGNGGVLGIAGDGKYLMGASVLATASFLLAIAKPKLATGIMLLVQSWGTVAAIWTGSLIWRVGSIFDSAEARGNQLAALFATQVGPGAGLYLGLLGGLTVAITLGFVSIRRLLATTGRLRLYYIVQCSSSVVGALFAVVLGLGDPGRDENSKPGAIPAKKKNIFKNADPGDNIPEKQRRPDRVPEAVWESPDRAVRLGDVQVQISGVSIGKVPLKDIVRKSGVSQDDLLIVKLTIANVNPVKKVEYHSWAGGSISFGSDFASLKDNFGNNYKRITFGFGSSPLGAVEHSESIYPNKWVSEVLVFELPLDTAIHLDLELPAENYGGEGVIRYRIPAKAIVRLPRE